MKKIKPVIQKDLKDCGVCCMQYIFMYFDGYVRLEKLREDTCTNEQGTTAYHIIETFKKWGFDALGIFNKDITDNNLTYPLIAHVKLHNGLYHFVVVKNIIKNTVYIMDPSVGDKKLTIEEFNHIFTGNLILMHPRSKLIKMDKGLSIQDIFSTILCKEKFLVLKIIMTSLIMSASAIIISYYLKVGSNIIITNTELLKYVIIAFIIIAFIKVFSMYIREYYLNHLNNIIDVLIYPSFINHLFNLPLKSINSRQTGEIMTRISELSSIKDLITDIFVTVFLDSIMMLISLVILYFINKELSVILFIMMIIYCLMGIFFSKRIYKRIFTIINYQTDFNSVLTESVEMLESIKHLNVTNKFLKKIEYSLSKLLLSNFKFSQYINFTNLSKDVIFECIFFLINSYGFYQIINGSLNIIDLFTFNILLSYATTPMRNIINLLPKYNLIKASFSKISEFINIDEENLNGNAETINGDISFRNVSYSYNNYDYILKNVNLLIKEGEHVLLNGPSGSGKSTICKLLCKDILDFDGTIAIGNVNLLDINTPTIRNTIMYVSQNEKLIFGTVKDNIVLDRIVSDEEFYQVCDICCLESIVSKKKLRYETLIEPGITNLSGGEMQRIILARALLKKSKIIILDEALSEVDKLLEDKIIKNLERDKYTKVIHQELRLLDTEFKRYKDR